MYCAFVILITYVCFMEEERIVIKRGKKMPDYDDDKLGTNPLVGNLSIPVNKKYKEVLRNGVPLEEEHTMEATKFTKIYEFTDDKYHSVIMPIRCKEMLLYIIMSMEQGKDFIWIDKASYMENMGIKSPHTWRKAVAWLSLKNYISKHAAIKDFWWINPRFIFKGNRIAKYPNNIGVKYNDKFK